MISYLSDVEDKDAELTAGFIRQAGKKAVKGSFPIVYFMLFSAPGSGLSMRKDYL